MSSYENYSATSTVYDDTRVPIGVDIVLGCLAVGGGRLDEQTVLDAGCGTGSYAAAILEHVAAVEGVDLNPGMLEVAGRKLSGEIDAGRARLRQAPLDALPLEDGSVDGVMVNQVLHHLPDRPGEGRPETRSVLAELARVVRPGGSVIVNHCSHEQLRCGWWYTELVREAVERMVSRHVSLETLEGLMRQCGLEVRGRRVPVDALFQGRRYGEGLGPLDSAWRASDSLWALVDPEELKRVEAQVVTLDEAGELAGFVERNDARRPDVGQVTFVHAVRRA